MLHVRQQEERRWLSRTESSHVILLLLEESESLGDPWPGEGGMRATDMVKIFLNIVFYTTKGILPHYSNRKYD